MHPQSDGVHMVRARAITGVQGKHGRLRFVHACALSTGLYGPAQNLATESHTRHVNIPPSSPLCVCVCCMFKCEKEEEARTDGGV